MNCYCYFEKINRQAKEVIKLWEKSWTQYGWTPVVLGEPDFLKWPMHELFDAAVSKLPTINDRRYERACYRRWGAMSELGGLMLDYDVMNYGFRPEHLPYCTRLTIFDAYAPCVVLGSRPDYTLMCHEFSGYQPTERDIERGRPHTSDMHITAILSRNNQIDRIPICVEYGEPGWKTARLVHFATMKCPLPKLDIIRKLRPA